MSNALKNKTRRSNGTIMANCPDCCPTGRGRACFSKGWERDDDENEAPGAPVWRCGNCGHEAPRVHRRTKVQMMLARQRASR